LNQQDASIEKMEISVHEAPLVALEHPYPVVTVVIPMNGTSNDLVKSMPIQSTLTSLTSLFCNLKEE